jgi:hypothetical protein
MTIIILNSQAMLFSATSLHSFKIYFPVKPRVSFRPYDPLVALKGASNYIECVVLANPKEDSISWKKGAADKGSKYSILKGRLSLTYSTLDLSRRHLLHPFFSKKLRCSKLGKYLKKSCSYEPSEQCFFRFVSKYVVRFSRRQTGADNIICSHFLKN